MLENRFNAIIEVANPKHPLKLDYRLLDVEIPDKVTVISDENFRYMLYAITDFRNPEVAPVWLMPIGYVFIGVNTLYALEDIVFDDGLMVRSVCTRDGRLFIAEHRLFDIDYRGAVPMIMGIAGSIFNGTYK